MCWPLLCYVANCVFLKDLRIVTNRRATNIATDLPDNDKYLQYSVITTRFNLGICVVMLPVLLQFYNYSMHNARIRVYGL